MLGTGDTIAISNQVVHPPSPIQYHLQHSNYPAPRNSISLSRT